MNKINIKYNSFLTIFVVLAVLVTVIPAFAQTTEAGGQAKTSWGNHTGQTNRKPSAFGTVSAINGNIITLNGKQGFGSSSTDVTYTVDATNAKIIKNNIAGTISSIAIGDTLMVQGVISGTNVTATNIRDGVIKKGITGVKDAKTKKLEQTPSTPAITGNGQPVVAGTVSAINGSTLTITNKSNVSYTVDATSAKIIQDPSNAVILISNITVGDNLIIQGVVNGNSVVASNIIDQAKPSTTTTASTATEQPHKGFFGTIGSFFAKIFGF